MDNGKIGNVTVNGKTTRVGHLNLNIPTVPDPVTNIGDRTTSETPQVHAHIMTDHRSELRITHPKEKMMTDLDGHPKIKMIHVAQLQ